MTDPQLRRFLLRAASAAAAMGIAYAAVRWLLVWLLPFLLAAACAAALEPAAGGLQRRFHFRRGFAAFLLTLFTLFVCGGLLSLLGAQLLREARGLLEGGGAAVAALPELLDALLRRLERYAAACPPWLRDAVADTLKRSAEEAGGLLHILSDGLLSLLTSFAAALPSALFAAATAILALYFTLASSRDLKALLRRSLPDDALRRMCRLREGAARSAARWLKAELTLCALTFAEVFLSLMLFRQPYALLLSVLITLVDALPVFGTGTVLIPWAAGELLLGRTVRAAALAVLYLVTLTVHSVMEPRLLGAQAGLPPLLSLMAMYLGFRIFGVGGMVLCPFLLLLAAQIKKAPA